MDPEWTVANIFHPDGAVVYRAATLKVPLTGGQPHIKLEFDEFENFRAESVNIRVTGGPLRLASFRVPSKNRFNDLVWRMSEEEPLKGKVLSVEALNNGQLMIKIKMHNGEVKQITDGLEIVKTPRRKAMVHLEFENNEKLTGKEAKVPLQINYVLTDITSNVTYEMNLGNMKLVGFVRIRNQSNKHFKGNAGYTTTRLGSATQRREFSEAPAMTRSAPRHPTAAAAYGLDKSTLFLGDQFVTDRANILFITDAVEEVSVFFEVRINLPGELRDRQTQPIIEFPNTSVPVRLVDGTMTLYDQDSYILTKGSLTVGGTHVRIELEKLDHSVTVSNKPEFEQLESTVVEVTNALRMHHTGTKTTKLRIKFPEFMRWGSDNYNATFESDLTWTAKLQPGINTDVVKLKYLRQSRK